MVEEKGRKDKRKRKEKRKIFDWKKKLKILEWRIQRIRSRMRKTFGKIPKSFKNQVSQNDPQKFSKINNIILNIMVKSPGLVADAKNFRKNIRII